MKFNRIEAEKELSRLFSEIELTINEKKYPHLERMLQRGIDHNFKEYFNNQKYKELSK